MPDHTTISRRKAKLGKVCFYQRKHEKPVHIMIDWVTAGRVMDDPRTDRNCAARQKPVASEFLW